MGVDGQRQAQKPCTVLHTCSHGRIVNLITNLPVDMLFYFCAQNQ